MPRPWAPARSLLTLLAVAAASAQAPARAIIMRHDVPEASFLKMGERFPATAKVKRKGSGPRTGAEGTLVAPRWILTAAHVAATLSPGDVAILEGRSHTISRVVRHPSWKSDADLTGDIALLELEEPVKGVEPAAIYRGSAEEGMEVTFAGRGGQGTGLTGPDGEDGRLRGATNRVDKVGESWIRFRFDAPEDPGTTPLEGISGPGDSGGPAYAILGGKLHVVGVSSGQDSKPAGGKQGRYGVLEYYARVSHFSSWLDQVMKEGERRGGGGGAHSNPASPGPGEGEPDDARQAVPESESFADRS